MSEQVNKEQLMRYIEIEKSIQGLESQNVLKNYEVRLKAANDVGETIKSVEVTLKALIDATKKEKADVDVLLRGSIKETLGDKVYQKKLTKEQEEYLEAKNKEEVARQQMQDLEKQRKELEGKANEVKDGAEKLKKLYEERDNLLSDIFGGEYGSEEENRLEAEYDQLMDRKQRVSVANFKWTSGRVLLEHAVKQMSFACQRWNDLKDPKLSVEVKYHMCTEARNNNIAAMKNVRDCIYYLGPKIKFPCCDAGEMDVLEKATKHIYLDLQEPERHKHALICYTTTMKRAAALLQWFDNVIDNTIKKDLDEASKKARDVEQKLRAERIRLIREKIAECGGDVSAINDAGLKGLTDGFSNVDQQKMKDEDMDSVCITRPAPVGDDLGIPDAQQQERMPPAPTPVPKAMLAQKPTEDELFGDISELKAQYKKDTEEYIKTQDLNKARMQQGLDAKLAQRAQRRHKRT